MFVGKKIAFILAALAAGSALPASADTISYTNFEVVNNVNVHITCSGYIAGCTGYYGSGEFRFYNGNAQTLVAQTWCIDVTHDVLGPWSGNPGASNTFDITPVQQAGIMSNVWDGGAVGHGHQITWTTLGEIGGLMKYGTDHISDPLVSSAVQLAIWQIEYGSAIGTDSDSDLVDALANSLRLDALGNTIAKDWNLAWLQHCDGDHCNQGQLMLLVPEPSTFVLFGSAYMAFLGLLGFGRFRRGKLA